MSETLVEDVLIESDGLAAAKAALMRVRMLPHPFSIERVEKHVDAGQTIFEMMGACGCKPGRAYIVLLNGEFIPPEMWKRIRPKPRAEVIIKAVPMDSGNGDENKTLRTILQIVIIIVVIVLLVFVPELAPIWVMAGAALANLAVVALLPPKFAKPKLPGGAEEPGFAISAARNVANPGGPLPRVYGRHRMFPFYAARSFTEIVGDKQYLRMLFTCGQGPVQMSALRIGESPIEQFSAVEVEIREGAATDAPLTLFSNTVLEVPLTLLLQANVPIIRTTDPDADEISIDLVFPGGLFDFGRTREPRSVEWVVDYSPVGAGVWTRVGSPTVTADTSQPVRRGMSWKVTRGQYDVRVMRRTPTLGKSNISEDLYWSAIRTLQYVDPIPEPGMSKIAVRIRATEQLSGVVDTLSCLVEAKLRTWNGASWTSTPAITRNPAAAYLDILTGAANKRPIPDSRISLANLGAWYTACATAGRTYDAVIDYRSTVFECLHDVAVAGRAAFAMPDGKYGVVRDILQTVPVQIFTQRNSWGFTGRKFFPDRIDGFRMPFVDETNDYQAGEVTVLDDGVDPLTASKFELLQLPGITNPDTLHKEGRYHLACVRLRPETWDLYADVENLVCQRGDLVQVLHDVLLVGLSSGRVKTVTVNGAGAATSATLDEALTMEAATNYGIRFRRSDGVFTHSQVVTVVGEDQRTVTFTTPIAAASIPAAGDIFAFGVLGVETLDAIVKAIMPGRDLSARLELLPAAPDVHTADTGPIPPYDPGITLPPHLRIPPAARVDAIVSEATTTGTAGTVATRVTILWSFASGEGLDGATIEAAWQEHRQGINDPWVPITAPINLDAMTLDAEPLPPGTEVNIRIRSVSRFKIPSAWVTVTRIDLPNPPPMLTTYVLHPIAGGYRATIARKLTHPKPPRVTGLRLVQSIGGSTNGTQFPGPTAKFTWNAISLTTGLGDGEDDLGDDPEVSYRVQISTGGVVRFTANPGSPGFDYTYAINVDDHLGSPQRLLTCAVWVRTLAGIDGVPATLTVSNPAPSMVGYAPTVTQRPGGLFIDWSTYPFPHNDRDKYDVLVDTVNPPVHIIATVSWKERNTTIPNQPNGTTLYVRIVPHDVFGPGTGSGVTVFNTTPSTPTTVRARVRPGGIQLSWDRIPDANFAAVEVRRSTTNNVATTSVVRDGGLTGYFDTDDDLVDATPYFYWVRVRNTSGGVGAHHTGATAGTRVVTSTIVGYVRTGGATPYTFGATADLVLSATVDTLSNEIDMLVSVPAFSNIKWGELRLTGKVKTTPTVNKFTAATYSVAACCFDGADMQVMLYDATGQDVKYARLSNDGTIEQAPVTKFTSNATDFGSSQPHIAVTYDKVNANGFFVVYVDAATGPDVVYLAKLDLTGTITLAKVAFHTTADFAFNPVLAMDSEGNLHVLITKLGDAIPVYQIAYYKLSPTGTVLVGPVVIQSLVYGVGVSAIFAIGLFVDAQDSVFVVTNEVPATGAGSIYRLGRMTNTGEVRSPLVRVLTTDDGAQGYYAAIAHDARDDTWALIRTGDLSIHVDTFAKVNG